MCPGDRVRQMLPEEVSVPNNSNDPYIETKLKTVKKDPGVTDLRRLLSKLSKRIIIFSTRRVKYEKI